MFEGSAAAAAVVVPGEGVALAQAAVAMTPSLRSTSIAQIGGTGPAAVNSPGKIEKDILRNIRFIHM